MANRYAVATGNWSSTSTWDGTTTLPGAGDTVRPNTFTVTIDQNLPAGVTLIQNASSPAAAGGSFICSSSRDLGGAIIISSTSTQLLAISGTSTITGIASSTGGATGGLIGIGMASGTINLTVGSLLGGGTLTSQGLSHQGGTLTLTATSISGGAGGPGLTIGNSGTAIVGTGSVAGGTTGAGITSTGSLALTVTGTTTAGSSAFAVNPTVGTFTADFQGTVTATTGSVAVSAQLATAIIRTRGNLVHGPTGRPPISTIGQLYASAGQTITLTMYDDANAPAAGTPVVLSNQLSGIPSVGDVRSGIAFGSGLALTGTLAVPSPSSVGVGVPTDNTVGTAALTPDDIWDALTVGMTTNGSIGKRIKNVSTVDVTAEQITQALDQG